MRASQKTPRSLPLQTSKAKSLADACQVDRSPMRAMLLSTGRPRTLVPPGGTEYLSASTQSQADVGNRTRDLILTMDALCQLSYVGVTSPNATESEPGDGARRTYVPLVRSPAVTPRSLPLDPSFRYAPGVMKRIARSLANSPTG
jgi:hypothetical protein